MTIPENAERILNILTKAGYEAYIVGGCVRDWLRGVNPKDWDICTSALPDEVAACLLDQIHGIKIANTGLRFGGLTAMFPENDCKPPSGTQKLSESTPTVFPNEDIKPPAETQSLLQSASEFLRESYEITTFRRDGFYSDKRRPDSVSFTGKLEEDLSRRDFTMNGMAYNPKTGLIDLFGGEDDVKSGVIKAIGDAKKRFNEDALRILRALRFASVLGYDIEDATKSAIHECKDLLAHVSAERINAEWSGIIMGDSVSTVMSEFFDVISVFIPELSQTWNPATDDGLLHLAPADLIIRLSILLDSVGSESAKNILRRLRYPNDIITYVSQLVFYNDMVPVPEPADVKRWLNRLGVTQYRRLLDIKRIQLSVGNISNLIKTGNRSSFQKSSVSDDIALLDKISDVLGKILLDGECYNLADLAVKGNDLIAAGFTEGTEIGATLERLLDAVISGEIENNKDELLQLALGYDFAH